MTILLYTIAISLVMPAICVRLIFLAPTRLGALTYYSNVFNDFFRKRLRWPQHAVEISLLLVGVLILSLSEPLGWLDGLLILTLVVSLELILRFQERRILNAVYAHQDARWRSPNRSSADPLIPGAYPHPSPHPELAINLNGPFVVRLPRYDLGDLVVGRVVDLEIIVGNHSLVPSQVPTLIAIQSSGQLVAEPMFDLEIPPLASGGVFRGVVRLIARRTDGPGHVKISVTCGDRTLTLVVGYRSIFETSKIVKAEITRYAGACRAAFAWRGDMDHYDTSTFQSVEGLRHTLELAARYRFPQTMYLSTRLTLDPREADEFYTHFGVNRGQSQIPEFISWLREHVKLCHQMTYPFDFDKPYALELGNHGHLHYGTDAAAAPGNGWKRGARMGEGNYDWLSANNNSFAEQRDNAMAARRLCEELFYFTPKSWGIPDSTRDRYTPAALEAAGCQVVSDSNASSMHNVLLQPLPHHPNSTGLVELTKRYPGDPESIFHLAMIQYWIHRAHRRGIPVIFMCHQHMRQFSGHSCARFTEYILRYVLTRFNGDLYINTVYGIGIYWNEVFSPKNRTVYVQHQDNTVVVRNTGRVELAAVPVDVFYQGKRRATFLLDLPPGSAFKIFTDGRIETL